MIRAVYHKGSNYVDLDVSWEENDERVDLSDRDVTLRVFPYGGAAVFTKTGGFTKPVPVDGVVPDPNLVVAWDGAADLDLLDADTYVLFFQATKVGEGTLEMFAELVIRENAPNVGYCELSDLLLGDMLIDEKVNRYDYINGAADDMNSRLGYIYTLPIQPADPARPVGEASTLVLKNINKKLASGRLIMAIASGGEEMAVNAYGQSLVQEAYNELALVLDGSLPLVGAARNDGQEGSSAPETFNVDSKSGVDAFYSEFVGYRQSHTCPPFPLAGGVWKPNDA